MTVAWGLAVIIGSGLWAYGRVWRHRVEEHSLLLICWRWLTGGYHDGAERTDAGWLRKGKRPLTRSGHASRWAHKPRLHRAGWRLAALTLVMLAGYAWVAGSAPARWALEGLGVAAAVVGTWYGRRKWRARRHRRTWVHPLHVALHKLVNVPLPDNPAQYLAIAPDRSSATVKLPPGFRATTREKDRIVRAAADTLGLESPDPRWVLAGPKPRLELVQASPPPDLVTLGALQDAISEARPGELILGTGRRGQLVKVSLLQDSPHIGISAPTQAGKSTTVKLLAAQMAYHGAVIVFADFKEISASWADSTDGTLPNIAYAREDHEIHELLLWLQAEVRRRNKVARFSARRDGSIGANVGDRILVVAEEVNIMRARLRDYWAANRQPGQPQMSPAVTALAELLLIGRQVKVNIVAASQYLTADAIGGSAARENLAARIIQGRYSQNGWKLLAGDFRMPPASTTRGRGQLVTDHVREVQIGFLSDDEAYELATQGEIAVPPAGMPCVPQVTQVPGRSLVPAGDGAVAPGPGSPGPVPLISLRQAITDGVLGVSLEAARTARKRDPAFPRPVTLAGQTAMYDPAELEAWNARRLA